MASLTIAAGASTSNGTGLEAVGERPQQEALVAISAMARSLACLGVYPHIGHFVEPSPTLLIEIRIIANVVDDFRGGTDREA